MAIDKDLEVSVFKSTRETEVYKNVSIFDIIDSIEQGRFKVNVAKVRGGDKEFKKKLPTFAFHGIFDGFRQKKNFVEATGLIILDIDNIPSDQSLENIKSDIMMSSDSVFATMISPSGNGIKVLYYVESDLVNQDTYRSIGKELVSLYEHHGDVDYLSITDCLIATYDPNIKVNWDAVADRVQIKEVEQKNVELEPLDKSKTLWEDPQEFFETVLEQQISENANNNFHFIQVAMMDLAKFGFKHPEHDLSFVVDSSESYFKASSENKQRFAEAAEVSRARQQVQWAYKMVVEEEEDDYIDYASYAHEEDDAELDESDFVSEGSEEVDSTDMFIGQAGLFEDVLGVIQEGNRVGKEISLSNFSDIFRFKGTGILTITGIPGHGKTEFLDQCLLDLARYYGDEAVVVGFEQTPQEHIVKLIRRSLGVDVTDISYYGNKDNVPVLKAVQNFVTRHFHHLDTTKSGGNIKTILEQCALRIADRRKNGGNVQYLVIDPFNMLSVKGKINGHEKVEEILRQITHFSHQMKVMVVLVAHPTKMQKDEATGKFKVPDFYSVKGSSAFFEMSYHGLVVYRTGYNPSDPVEVKVLKVKQNNLGRTGESAFFMYDKPSGRYMPLDSEDNMLPGDYQDKDWLSAEKLYQKKLE